jgi:hypothetical protein
MKSGHARLTALERLDSCQFNVWMLARPAVDLTAANQFHIQFKVY